MPSDSSMSPVADQAPTNDNLTDYDLQHLTAYLRLLDAQADGADWREAAEIVLNVGSNADPERAYEIWRSHLIRAQWMTTNGYAHLLKQDQPSS